MRNYLFNVLCQFQIHLSIHQSCTKEYPWRQFLGDLFSRHVASAGGSLEISGNANVSEQTGNDSFVLADTLANKAKQNKNQKQNQNPKKLVFYG